jgi:hypothetical protein
VTKRRKKKDEEVYADVVSLSPLHIYACVCVREKTKRRESKEW